jgi:hypothetical protein
MNVEIGIRHGKLSLASLALECPSDGALQVQVGKVNVPAKMERVGKRLQITFNSPIEITTAEKLLVSIA